MANIIKHVEPNGSIVIKAVENPELIKHLSDSLGVPVGVMALPAFLVSDGGVSKLLARTIELGSVSLEALEDDVLFHMDLEKEIFALLLREKIKDPMTIIIYQFVIGPVVPDLERFVPQKKVIFRGEWW